jgi:ribosomal protein S18 acetylase RimI-like enzyme
MSAVLATTTLVPVTAADIAFEQQVFAESRPELVFLPEHAMLQQFAAQCRQHSDAARLLIMAGGTRVGRVLLRHSDAELRLVDIAILESRRGQGLGSSVLGELIEQARASGVPLRLSVRPENRRARTLYSRLGLAEVAASETGIELVTEAA